MKDGRIQCRCVDLVKMVEERNFKFLVGPDLFKEDNLLSLKPRFHKSGLELLIKNKVFSQEIAEVVADHLEKMKVVLAKGENAAKKRKMGGIQTKLEAAFAKAAKTAYDDGDGSDSDNESDS